MGICIYHAAAFCFGFDLEALAFPERQFAFLDILQLYALRVGVFLCAVSLLLP